jgi:hypothetical protein
MRQKNRGFHLLGMCQFPLQRMKQKSEPLFTDYSQNYVAFLLTYKERYFIYAISQDSWKDVTICFSRNSAKCLCLWLPRGDLRLTRRAGGLTFRAKEGSKRKFRLNTMETAASQLGRIGDRMETNCPRDVFPSGARVE